MKSLALLALVMFLVLPSVGFGQRKSGISVSGGLSAESGFSLSISYFHPIVMKQMYVSGGVHSFNVGGSAGVTDDFSNLYFAAVNQVYAGIRLGDYLFATPKLSYNWYGKYSSLGWGFTGGFLIHPSQRISFGFMIGHDQIRLDSSLDSYGPVAITSLSVVVDFVMGR